MSQVLINILAIVGFITCWLFVGWCGMRIGRCVIAKNRRGTAHYTEALSGPWMFLGAIIMAILAGSKEQP